MSPLSFLQLSIKVTLKFGLSSELQRDYIIFNNYLQGEGCDQISLSEVQPCIVFSKVASGSIIGKISPNSDNIISKHTREVNNRTRSQSNASTDASILMLVLKFHLLNITDKNCMSTFKFT